MFSNQDGSQLRQPFCRQCRSKNLDSQYNVPKPDLYKRFIVSECVGHTINQFIALLSTEILSTHHNFPKFTSFCRHRALSQYSSTRVHYTANQQFPTVTYCIHQQRHDR